jgi:predicted O-methyltransferase YrrM
LAFKKGGAKMAHDPNQYLFTNNWFEGAALPVWSNLIPQLNPARLLEVGSYEGASTCFLINTLSRSKEIEIHCVDTWQGGVEHTGVDMSSVESRFRHNTDVAVKNSTYKPRFFVHKGFSDLVLSKLLAQGLHQYFDFIYIDGSHQAPDVICDAILGFRLLKVGGVMAFDDYLWGENPTETMDPVRCPKPAIDAFTSLYCRKVRIIPAPLYQLYVQKVSN